MNKEFIPYEEALALKELGFNEPCIARHTKLSKEENEGLALNWLNISEVGTDNGEFTYGKLKNYNTDFYKQEGTISAPLYQQAFRWFRDKHNWNGWTDKGFTETFRYNICENNGSIIGLEGFKTYEEAELDCLKKLIEIVKEKV